MNNPRFFRFRIWNIKRQEFVLPPDNKIGGNIFILTKNGNLEAALNNDNYIFQQWTGLVDKYGQSIYEGDVVDASFYPAGAWEGDIRDRAIKFVGGLFGIEIDVTVKYKELMPFNRFKDIKVIGNICQTHTNLS